MKKLFILLCIALSVAGCGKRGRLEFPENATYPRQYPAPRNPVVVEQDARQSDAQPSSLMELNKQLEKESQ